MKPVRIAIVGSFAVTSLIIGGCATTDQVQYEPRPMYAAAYPTTFGVIDAIEVVGTRSGDSNVAAGTILGGIVGGVLCHQIGSGRGNDVATVAGAIGGAVVGHEIAANRSAGSTYRISVRLDNGSYQTFLQDDLDTLRVGDRIQINNDRVSRYVASGGRYDVQSNRFEERGIRYDGQGYRVDERGNRYDAQGNRIDERGYRVEDRGFRRDAQGYWVDARGNRYDAQGYWVDERGIRHEYQDAPRAYRMPPQN
ncbi:MAG: glycine zipper 2TM domain-containing protein [Acidobacteriota bacterium]